MPEYRMFGLHRQGTVACTLDFNPGATIVCTKYPPLAYERVYDWLASNSVASSLLPYPLVLYMDNHKGWAKPALNSEAHNKCAQALSTECASRRTPNRLKAPRKS